MRAGGTTRKERNDMSDGMKYKCPHCHEEITPQFAGIEVAGYWINERGDMLPLGLKNKKICGRRCCSVMQNPPCLLPPGHEGPHRDLNGITF